MQHHIRTWVNLPDRLAIDGNLIMFGVDPCAGHDDDLAVHRNAAGSDQILAIAPRSNAGAGQHLL
jgi:hypothetical protein